MKAAGPVRRYMTTTLVTLRPDMSVHEAIHVLLSHRFSGAPVLDADGRLIGILSNKDCIRTSFSASYHQEWGGLVADAMSSPVVTVDADEDIVEVAEKFLRGRYRRYPVVENGRLAGLVSRHDILRALGDLWGQPPGGGQPPAEK